MTNDAINRKEQILLEIGQRLEAMYEEKERSCISCCEKITEKYAEELEPFLKEYEELENGDRAQSTSDESDRGTS